ncbi:carbon monoxide dehydrogenase [Novosphingobium endophyticum]|uniref:Carbon monoxide dehydrogenase n=1 Tax=Novosphingobium endophyticum TaxID=1955250 RepID=A0A916TWJ0_9SPHN|nr:FAD binding domain-containing protein [Novosphingobium endophyticum]GGC15851.1 carbon monoxide dehydrogenase [Novosphingobium endophyticum]
MKPPPFDYAAPSELDEVVELLAEQGEDARLLAGGQSLVPMLALRLARPSFLIDLNRVSGVSGIALDGNLRIGAMARQAAILADPVVARELPVLAEAIRHIGHLQTRNRGTFGGSLCLSDPAAELPALALMLDAEFELRSRRGVRTVSAADFFTGPYSTAIEFDEVLVAANLPCVTPDTTMAIREISRRHGDFALVGAAVRLRVGADRRIADARLSWFGIAHQPIRSVVTEAALIGQAVDGLDCADVGAAAVAEIEARDDVHATAGYRSRAGARLVAAMFRDTLEGFVE